MLSILADIFPVKQVPRWADEGMSVLSEPEAEQALRARDLTEPLSRDVLFHLDVLMTADGATEPCARASLTYSIPPTVAAGAS